MHPDLPPRFGQLRVRDLLLLEHLDDLGSLTETAAHLHVTQSAITQALQVLEQGFGTTLVERGRRGQRGVRLTEAGQAALQRLRIAHHEMRAALDAATGPGLVNLRIGALPLAMISLLPVALDRLRRRAPSVHVTLTESTVSLLWRQLQEGDVDAIVCRLPAVSDQQSMPAGVVHRTVGHESLALVGSRAHPLARKRRRVLADLLACDWVLPPVGSFTRLAFDQLFVRAGLKPPRAAITSISFHTNLRLAAQGGLLAVAPVSAIQGASLDLQVLHAGWGRQDTGIVLACRESALASPGMPVLWDCLQAVP
jgi:DNA-binding transcriptional LysR family regulator